MTSFETNKKKEMVENLDALIEADLAFLEHPDTYEKIQRLKNHGTEETMAQAVSLLQTYKNSLEAASERMQTKLNLLETEENISLDIEGQETLPERKRTIQEARNKIMRLLEEAEVEQAQLVSRIGTPVDPEIEF